MTTAVATRKHTQAIITALAATGKQIGDGETPDDVTVPYVVAYALPGGSTSGPLSDPDADIEIPYQFTCVGRTRYQAEAMRDKVDAVLHAATLTIADRSVSSFRPEPTGGVDRDDDVSPPLFYAISRWRLTTTPT